MKKPITIGVIAVIATILVTSAVDYSAIGAKPIDQIYLQTSGSENDGEMTCPNGSTVETSNGSVSFNERNDSVSGSFGMASSVGQKQFVTTLWNGNIQSGQFTFTGIGNENSEFLQFCGLSFPVEQTLVTVWGECGNDVTVHFESELGYSGSFTGNVLCV